MATEFQSLNPWRLTAQASKSSSHVPHVAVICSLSAIRLEQEQHRDSRLGSLVCHPLNSLFPLIIIQNIKEKEEQKGEIPPLDTEVCY